MQKPGHRKNPAAVALGRLGGLAGRGKAKARKVTSEMARRAVLARWAKHKASLPLLLVLLMACGESAFCQGSIFLYTFSGDDSPLHVSATFTATQAAIATRLLTTTNIISGYMEQGGRQAPFAYLYMPVGPVRGDPGEDNTGHGPKVISFLDKDEIDIAEGWLLNTLPQPATISFMPWIGIGGDYVSHGLWTVAVVPEPSCLSLLALVAGCCLVRLRAGTRPGYSNHGSSA